MITGALSPSGGGLFTAVASLARALARLPETEVRVFGSAAEGAHIDGSDWRPASVSPCAVRGPRRFGYAPDLLPRMREWGPDLLHAHGLWMYPSVASREWSRRTRRAHIVSPHGMLDSWAVRNSRWKKRLAGWLYEGGHLASAACVHALNRAEAEAIRNFGLRNPVCVIPNGVELPESSGPKPPGLKSLLFLGRIHRKKGLAELLRGWAMARREEPSLASEWRLDIGGWDEGQRLELERLADELNAGDSVRFLGPLVDAAKAAAFSGASGFVMPSFSEGLPMTVLEAWSYRLPVMMTDACNLPEGFEESAALRIEPNPDAIGRGLIEWFRLPQTERTACGERGRRLVERKFAWPAIARDFAEVYAWTFGGGRPPKCVIA